MGLTKGQQRCVDTLDRPLVVAAGAGSGKTFTLTKRIVGAFQSGYVTDIDEVCAITFTKKAAAELKSRIKAELRACGFIEQALRVDEAWISTIHGMCARMLRAHAIELGIDPAFGVAEGADVDGYLAQAVELVLVEAQQSASPRLDALFSEYPARSYGGFGTSVEGMLLNLVTAASTQEDGADALVLPGRTLEPHLAVESALDALEGLLVSAEGEKQGAKRDEWIGSTSLALEDAHAALAAGGIDYEKALALLAPFKLSKAFGSKEYKAKVDEAKGIVGSCAMEVRLGAARLHLETLVDLAQSALAAFSALKQADGVLDNNDLLVMASRAVREYPAITAQYVDKFKLVMVDEFQDTDQMQVDMIKKLAGEGACRLCTVGDAQQSIYRFRGADVSVYRRHLAAVREAWPDSIIELSDNFRSHPDILAFVDRVFEKPDMFGGEFMSLAPGRDESRVKTSFSDADTRIIVQHTSRPRIGVSQGEAVAEVARRVADEFAALADAGHKPGDMVVLLGRMKNADVFAQTLRSRGLPCIVAGGSVFAQTPEAQVMQELVRVIANPRESQSLFNVLASPLFALTAGDLLDVGGLNGFWRAAFDEEGGASRSPQLACALRVMGAMRKAIGRRPVANLMEQVASDSGWLSRLQSGGPEGLASAGNLFKAIRMVRAIEQSGAMGPASVARRFSDTLSSAKEAPGALSVSGSDSVRIMTIHASKGLEFPIVAVAEVKDNVARTPKLLVSSVAGKVYVSLDLSGTLERVGDTVDAATSSSIRSLVLGECAGEEELACAVASDEGALHRRLALADFAAAGDEEEAKRLLYVAITRAREALVVASVGTRTKANPAGIPNSALQGVFAALDPTGAGFENGRSSYGFGGTADVVLECVALEEPEESSIDSAPFERSAQDDGGRMVGSALGDGGLATHTVIPPSHPESGSEAASLCNAGWTTEAASLYKPGWTTEAASLRHPERRPKAEVEGAPENQGGGPVPSSSFAIPAPENAAALECVPFNPTRQNVFSYSSVSEASHKGDILEKLAEAFAVSVDDAADSGNSGQDAAYSDGRDFGGRLSMPKAVYEDDFWDFDVTKAYDEDRATDLGTAFHRLAQYAVVARKGADALSMPPDERIDALSRTCNLDTVQRARLLEALGRWFGCDMAREMEGLSSLSAEVPFFVPLALPHDAGMAYLEGEIDLVGYDPVRTHATVVDYKTGGSPSETSRDLRLKHVLQAACYALAIMKQGIVRVDAVFVRVERSRSDSASEPQCVRYRFEQHDMPELTRAIGEAYLLSL